MLLGGTAPRYIFLRSSPCALSHHTVMYTPAGPQRCTLNTLSPSESVLRTTRLMIYEVRGEFWPSRVAWWVRQRLSFGSLCQCGPLRPACVLHMHHRPYPWCEQCGSRPTLCMASERSAWQVLISASTGTWVGMRKSYIVIWIQLSTVR